jgi:tetratricopeptide (TPR) repeat protein
MRVARNRQRGSRGGARGAGALLALLVLGLQAGCAGLGGPLGAAPDRMIRPEAPPEYDVLVAQQLELDGRHEEALAAYGRAVAKDDSSAYLHRKLAEQLAQANRIDESLRHAHRAHELDPDDVSTRIFLGQLYRLRRDVDSAERVLSDADGRPIAADAAFLLYHIYLESRRPQQALEMAQWWVQHEPASIRARMALAQAYQRLDRPLDAEATLRDAIEFNPGNLRLYGALARSLRQRGDVAGEVALYREILAQDPSHHATLAALADAQMASGDLDGGIATYEEIERRYPSDLRSNARLGYLLYKARRFGEAQERFERILAANPEEHEIWLFLGLARRGAGDLPGALAALEQIPPGSDHYADARTQMATIHERRADFDAALAEVERALADDPSRSLELYALTLRAKGGDFDGAVGQLQAMIEARPEDDELIYNLGVIYGEAQRVDEALGYMQQALDRNPDNASALNYIGYTWAERGERLDDAERLIVRAVELRPDDGYIADSLGWVYYMRARTLIDEGDPEEARALLDQSLRELYRADELTGGDPVVSEHLGDAYLLLDEKSRALEKFEEAVRLEPRQGEQPQLYEKLETLRRELR